MQTVNRKTKGTECIINDAQKNILKHYRAYQDVALHLNYEITFKNFHKLYENHSETVIGLY